MGPSAVISKSNIDRLNICSSCLRALRQNNSIPRIRHHYSRYKHIARQGEQATPLKGFYKALLNSKFSSSPTITPPKASIPPPPTTTPPDKQQLKVEAEAEEEPLTQVQTRARIVFGSPLAGPIARQASRDRASTYVAGILVPPKPVEPDNCCMSGCVNCVWDMYSEDIEEWASKAAEAQVALKAQGVSGTGSEDAKRSLEHKVSEGRGKGIAGGAGSVDDDGGGSEANWVPGLDQAPPKAGEDLFSGIPVGIREFMKTEKMLRTRLADVART